MIDSNALTNCLIDATKQGVIDWSPPPMGTHQEQRQYNPWLFASVGAFDLRLTPSSDLEIIKDRVIYRAEVQPLYKVARKRAGLSLQSEEEIEAGLTQKVRTLMHENKK
jgi:hypothetical protein